MAALSLTLPLRAEEPIAESTASADSAAFAAMGYAMASQLRLNIGFTDAELDSIFEGMRLAATDGGEPADFQAAVQRAQQIYMTKMQAFQAEEQQRIESVASDNKAEAEAFFAELDAKEGILKSDSGLRYEMVTEGDGTAPTDSDRVVVNYRGTLIDGTEFDANDNAEFAVNRVVPGFSEGLKLLKPGGKIRLYIPSDLGYGDRPSRPGSPIEPGSALLFDVELLEVKSMPKPPSGPPPALPPNLPKPPPPPTTRPPGPPPNMTPPPPPTTPPPARTPPSGS